jgi:hypothetical protein
MLNVTEVKSPLTCGNYDFKMFRRNLMEKGSQIERSFFSRSSAVNMLPVCHKAERLLPYPSK